MANGSMVLEEVQEVGLPDSGLHLGPPGKLEQCKVSTNTMPVIINGYGTCRNAFKCGCTGYVGWGSGYACRCGCGFGDHY